MKREMSLADAAFAKQVDDVVVRFRKETVYNKPWTHNVGSYDEAIRAAIAFGMRSQAPRIEELLRANNVNVEEKRAARRILNTPPTNAVLVDNQEG